MEEANRYFLVMYIGSNQEIITSDREYKDFLRDYNKTNRDEKNPRVKGNLRTIHSSKDSNYIIKYSIYRKITKKASLKTIDEATTNRYEEEIELKKRYQRDVQGGKGKIYVGYMYNGEVRTLPVFYKKDKKYVNYDELTNLMVDNAINDTFLANIWSDKKLNSPEYRKNIAEYLEDLQKSYGKYLMDFYHDENIVKESIRRFMNVWCSKEGRLNQRRVREIGSIVKNNLEKKTKENKTEKVKKLLPYETVEEIRLF